MIKFDLCFRYWPSLRTTARKKTTRKQFLKRSLNSDSLTYWSTTLVGKPRITIKVETNLLNKEYWIFNFGIFQEFFWCPLPNLPQRKNMTRLWISTSERPSSWLSWPFLISERLREISSTYPPSLPMRL